MHKQEDNRLIQEALKIPRQPADFQYSIYSEGMLGKKPKFPIILTKIQEQIKGKLDLRALNYVEGGAALEDTVQCNLDAFKKWRIIPRHLRNVRERDLSVSLFETHLKYPILLAPIGVQSIVHPDAEIAVAEAANSVGIPMVVSTASSKPLEEIAKALKDTPRWFQLYWPKDPELTKSFLKRAETAGYSALVITLDTRLLGWRPRDLEEAYLPFLNAEGIANYLTDPHFLSTLEKPPEEDIKSAALKWAEVFADQSQTWDDLAFIRQNTKVPIILKGVLHPDDAKRAIEAGMDGIIVSNHGGRQLGGAIAALDALPDIVKVVGNRIPILFDSGIRCGADIIKAIALGARAALIGRPYLYGLALGGRQGVKAILQALLADLDIHMALSGFRSLAELNPQVLQSDR